MRTTNVVAPTKIPYGKFHKIAQFFSHHPSFGPINTPHLPRQVGGFADCLYQVVDTFDQRMSAGMALTKLGTVIIAAHGTLHVVARRFG